jgi:branched-chain amino acid transport system permease protein
VIARTRDRAQRYLRRHWRDPNFLVYAALLVGALLFPEVMNIINPDQANTLIGTASDAGVYMLLAIGLNVVVGFAGLLDLGYAAFFAIGAYTYGMLASSQMALAPPHIHGGVHLPFWILLLVAVFIAALCGAILGAPTLRLRGDYLAIVTLGFGEIVPRVFRNLGDWTGGVNAISAIDSPKLPAWFDGPWDNGVDFSLILPTSAGEWLKPGSWPIVFTSGQPVAFYVLMVLLLILCVIMVNNLYGSRIGRAWMAVREDEVAAAAMGVNTVNIKLLAFAIGASFSGFAGCYYGAKLSHVSPENFTFLVTITVLLMVTLGGMGNIPGVMVGALLIYMIQYYFLTNLPHWAESITGALGVDFVNQRNGAWPGLSDLLTRLNYIIFGLILVSVMLLRPQGLIPSRIREEELQKGTTDEAVFDMRTT